MYTLNFARLFREDVTSSIKYIKHILQAPAAAERLKAEIKDAYKKIKQMPFACPVVPDDYVASLGFRFVMVKNYMLFYTVEGQQINIIRFLYGRRDWMHILQDPNVME